MSELTVPERIAALREAMRKHDIHACLVPGADPHLSEYLPAHWQARTWLSGFNGSAGTLVVGETFAGLWTDSRYFEQAERQLDGSGITLMRLGQPEVPGHLEWLGQNLHEGQQLAVDGTCLSVTACRKLQSTLQLHGATLRTNLDLPGRVWADRPALPEAAIYLHPPAFVDETMADKLARLRSAMHERGATHHMVSALDEIAWLLNLRGSDVPCNPVFLAHLLVGLDSARLFVDANKLSDCVTAALAKSGIAVADYAEIGPHLNMLGSTDTVLLDPSSVVVALADQLDENVRRLEQRSPITDFKAIKTSAELAHIRATMREDGIALVQAFHQLEQTLVAGESVTELDVADALLAARQSRPGFVGESFATIAGYMAHGALPHYCATPEHHGEVKADGLLLVDSGGQYHGGTTDITRVWAFGATSAEQRADASRVLKGMIGLSRAQFPVGTSGPQVDALARAPLWAAGLDYGHGTGHGVGYFLNVHEGPHGIRPPRQGMPMVALEPGMITSIEPGVYKPGRHGVRHENLAVVIEAEETEFGRFLGFETLTLCPFDTRALDISLLDADEIRWLNDYHRMVEQSLSAGLEPEARQWLHERCRPLPLLP